jgi:hypothetical protein
MQNANLQVYALLLLLHPEGSSGVATSIRIFHPRARSCAELSQLGNENCRLLMRNALCQPTSAARGRSARIRKTSRNSCGCLVGASGHHLGVRDQARPPLNSYALAVLPELRNLRILRRER